MLSTLTTANVRMKQMKTIARIATVKWTPQRSNKVVVSTFHCPSDYPGRKRKFLSFCNKISIVQQMADNFHFKLVYLSAVNWNSRSSLFLCVCLRMFSRFCPHSIFWLNWTGSSRATPLGCKIHNHEEKEDYRKAFDLSLNRRQKRRRNIRFLTYAYVVWIRHRAVSYECIYEL